MPTAKPATDAILSDLQKSISDLQARARQHVDSIDARIRELVAKQSALKIPKAAFVAKILDDIRESAAGDAVLMKGRAKQASALHAHFPTRRAESVNFSGSPDFLTIHPKDLRILDYKDSPLALVGMFPELFEPAIEAWAEKLADELGLPATGNLDQVRKQFDALQAEIEALSGEREKAKAQLSELIDVSGSAFIDQDTFLRMRGEIEPLSEPFKGHKGNIPQVLDGETGLPKTAIGGDAWNEFWAHRRAEEEAEAALEAEAASVRNGRI